MGILKGLRARLRALLHPISARRDLDDEIRFHIELETEKNLALGMSPEEAWRLAIAHFGGVQRVREEHLDVRRPHWVEDFAGDVRYAIRALRRTPGLTAAAVLTLALGIGANTAIFSAVNAVVLQPLPLPHPERLMMLWEKNPEKNWYKQLAAPANYLDWREQIPAFQDIAAHDDGLYQVTLTGQGDPQLINLTRVTGNYFSTLEARPYLGRTLTDAETWNTGGMRTVVLSYRAWQDRFGGDKAIVGKTIHLNGVDVQVVGVMGEGFELPFEKIEAWMPFRWSPSSRADVSFRRAHQIRVVGRLKPGVTEVQANAQLEAVMQRLETQYPETNKLMGAGMTPLQEFLVGDTRLPLLVLMAAVALLLLIACANVGNLLLVQAAGRGREAALRLALGAGRFRLMRQAITESLVLSAIGGGCGLLLGWVGTHVLQRMQPSQMLRVTEFGLDKTVLGYVLLVTTLSGLLFGLAPALWARHRDPAEALKDGSRTGSESRKVKRWGDALVIGEVALALTMTVGAGLLVRSFWQLRHVDPGFDANGVLSVEVGLNQRYDSLTKITAFWNQVEERARAIPGVSNVAVASNIPLTGTTYTSSFIGEGRPAGDYVSEVGHRQVSADYFAAMRVPLLRGRTFGPEDRHDAPRVVIINSALAKRYYPNQNPIGQRVAYDQVPTDKSNWRTIVGVVGDEHQAALETAPRIEFLEPATQEASGQNYILVKTTGDPATLGEPMRRIIHDLDPTLAIISSRPMTAVRDDALARARFLTTLLLAFAAVGLALSIVGVYGLLAQLSRNRTREMGIRLALGAPRSGVRWLVVRHGLVVTSVGLVIGGIGAVLGSRLMSTLLFHVAPNDPVTLISVAVLLAATSVLAAWIPARNASNADPASALRAD
ncbi:MAG TPA: ABC transporter permease [Gemmatimonadaceae bacterium]|jgi:putative ABC transport system permease protein